MKSRFLFSSLIGGIVYFLLGWLVFGTILMEFVQSHMNAAINRKPEEMIIWALVVGNVAYGFLLGYIFNLSNINDMFSGLRTGIIIGIFVSITFDVSFFGTSTMYDGLTIIFVDILAVGLISGITGAVIGWYRSRGEKTS